MISNAKLHCKLLAGAFVCLPALANADCHSYDRAVASVVMCEEELKAAAMPYVRPNDYFAEMVKSDKHMLRVKAALLHKRNKLDNAAKRDRDRELRKMGKAVQESRTKEKAMAKNAQVAAVKQWRQKRKRGGGDDFDLALLDEAVRLDGKAKRDAPPAPSAKRIAKNRKFGTGPGLVRKRELKRNTDASTMDMRDFDKYHRNPTFGRGGARGGGRGGGGRGGGGGIGGRGGRGGRGGGGGGGRTAKRGSAKRPGKRARTGQH